MATLVLGAVGAVVGGMFGMPQLGYALGATAGSLLFPQKLPDQQGSRLSDLKVTTSTYGTCIPTVFSNIRLAGNIIASSSLIENSTTTTTGGGGKGGPSPSQTTTTYTYTQHFAIAICEGEITGIRKIWINGTLAYNVDSGTDIGTIIASNKIADSITIYNGTETQMPDAFIQSLIGADKTPAFRGTAYVVFKNFQLEKYGNRTPNIEFEVIKKGVVSYHKNIAYNFDINALRGQYVIFPVPYGTNPTQNFLYPSFSNLTQQVYTESFPTYDDYINNRKRVSLYDLYPDGSYNYNKTLLIPYIAAQDPPVFPIESNVLVYLSRVSKSYDNSTLMFTQTNYGRQFLYCVFPDGYVQDITDYVNPEARTGVYLNNSYSVKNDKYLFIVNRNNDTKPQSVIRIDCDVAVKGPSYEFNLFPASSTIHIKDIDISDNYVYILYNNLTIYKYDFNMNLIATITPSVAYDNIALICCGDGDKVWGASYNSGSGPITYFVEYSTGASILEFTLDETLYLGNKNPDPNNEAFGGQKLFYKDGDFYYQSRNPYDTHNNTIKSYIIARNLSNNATFTVDLTLGAMVKDIVELSDTLTSADIDVSQLNDELANGYMLTNRMTIREALEPLMQAYYFDAVETDGKIHFIKRGMNPVIDIPEDDLAACEYGSELPDQLFIDRKQTIDLPEEVTVSYMDINSNYNIGSQYSRRLINNTVNAVSMQFAMSLDQNKAKQISDVVLYNSWQERTTFKFTLSDKYLYLNPSDVITVNKDGTQYNVRIVEQDYANHIITVNAVEEDGTIYSQNAVGSDVPIAPNANADGSINIIGATNFAMLDIPILRDQDDQVGFYVAAGGFNQNWPGCQPYKSIDNGASFNAFGPGITSSSIVGLAQTSLGNFTGGNIFDETNSVTIYIPLGILSSATEIAVLNGDNLALVGNEIIQFKNASLIAPNTYKISSFIRGKFGTEWAMSTHDINERFVLLSFNSTVIETSPSSEYGLQRNYRPVTFGLNLDSVNDILFTNTAIAQKPYAPVEVSGGRDASGNATLNWIRRTRVGGSWNNYTDVPLGESTELYSVDIMNGSTVVRTINGLTTSNATYSAANQTTDFGSPQSSITYKVYQISSLVGRGYAGTGTF